MATSGINLSDFNKEELPDTAGMRFGLVVSEWNNEITESLYQGAFHTLLDSGTPEDQITRINVPGTFELPFGAKLLSQKDIFDAVIVIGCVIQGETKHFDFVCEGVTQGISQLNLDYDTPVIFCVLTDNTIEQSRARSGGKHGNKGIECAVSAIKMAALRRMLHT
ncbi:MAG: 6,7-dimethyl-8-ribityllumazine synthase [Owenweeksia sp.]